MPKSPKKSLADKKRERAQKIAYKLYQNRLLLNRPGNEHSDWVQAEKIAQSPLRKLLFKSHRPLIRLEKQLWEPLLAWANNQAVLSLLGVIGNVGLIVAVAAYVGSEKQRRDAEVLNAWQTLTSAYGQAGNGGRIRALEFLNASPGANWRRRFPWICAPLPPCVWPSESLAGINLSTDDFEIVEGDGKTRYRGSGAYLQGIQLPGAYLVGANLEGAYLVGANLEGAYLWEANLEGAYLWEANLEGADLWAANLEGADLWAANLEGASLGAANLEGAYLGEANLEGAYLWEANLEGASLRAANLEGAYLGEANLEGASLGGANLEGAILSRSNLEGAELLKARLSNAETLTEEQLSAALLCETELPDYIDLDPNADCDVLMEEYPWMFE